MTSIDHIQLSEEVLPLISQAWAEVERSIPQVPPSEGTLGFIPSETCKVLIDWVHGEVTKDKTTKGLNWESWGIVYFPKFSIIGQNEGDTPWAIIPLHIVGDVEIGLTTIQCGSYYKIFRKSVVKVSEPGRLTGLVLRSER
jgi:hypothetical protein